MTYNKYTKQFDDGDPPTTWDRFIMHFADSIRRRVDPSPPPPVYCSDPSVEPWEI